MNNTVITRLSSREVVDTPQGDPYHAAFCSELVARTSKRIAYIFQELACK